MNVDTLPLEKERIQKKHWLNSDDQFNGLFPPSMQLFSRRHWTPLYVSVRVADFLSTGDGTKVLDIGSGIGKFCLSAAFENPGVQFFGVEQRKSLIAHAEAAREKLQVNNVSFINGNFTMLDFRNYDHFYFFNSFYENLAGTEKIDDSIDYSEELYNYYNRYLYKQLAQMPSGTRLATYHSSGDEVPPDFHVIQTDLEGVLKFCIKI